MPERRRSWIAGLAPALFFALIAAALIGMDYGGPNASGAQGAIRAADDQNRYHLVAIEAFARQLPRVDLSDYPSATTPGYHLLLAIAQRALGLNSQGLRAVAALFTIGLLCTLGAALGARAGGSAGVALALPTALSLYVISSGVWLLPDNLAWWGALAIVLIALKPAQGVRAWILAGAILVGVAAVRQSHIWAAAVVWASAWLSGLGANGRRSALWSLPLPEDGAEWRSAARKLGVAVMCTLPAFALVGAFVWLWGGATPPMFQSDLERFNPATPGLALGLLGVYSVFFAGFAASDAARVWRDSRGAFIGAICAGAAVGLLAGALPASSYDQSAGRWSGVWNVLRLSPALMDRSTLFIALSTLGGACAAAWFALLERRARWVMAAALVSFVAAMSFNAMAWQRYLEPMLLMLTALSAAAVWAAQGERSRRTRMAAIGGALALAAAQGAITLRGLL